MVDFDTNARLLRQDGIKVIAASVDTVDQGKSIVDGMRLSYVQVLSELDGPAVASATGAQIQTGDRTFLHATGFLLNAEGKIVDSVYSSGPIGRFTANDILKVVVFRKAMAARNS